jgi:NTP pyrophosphatase (non-canonical NTP hydrolase)|tara:strand:- start:1398 stop:1652 length:255 start_codon:yes stop_codon:yes gene_type:complete
MKKREEMLVITMEECGELIQACSKMIRSKGKTKYLRDLQDEIGDVMTMIEIMKISGLVTDEQIADRMAEKKEKLMKWSMLFSED